MDFKGVVDAILLMFWLALLGMISILAGVVFSILKLFGWLLK
ncbi:MAG: hypothetical protein V4739_04740 [Pseudomonadota bacterium]